LDSATIVKDLSNSLVEGKEIDRRELTSGIRKLTYASGQILGIPTRNMYNVAYGLTKRISPETAYKWNDAFYQSAYKADLAKAIENEDQEMTAMIVGLMLNENVGGIEDEKTRTVMNTLITNGYNVIPKSVPDKFTYQENEETVEVNLTKKQKDAFASVYFEANKAVTKLVNLVQFDKMSQEEQAAAVKFVYSNYYDLAVNNCIKKGSTPKNELLTSVFKAEILALNLARIKSITTDKDKTGKTISNSRKKKVHDYIESLRLTALQKNVLMYLAGYKPTEAGQKTVEAYLKKQGYKAEEISDLWN
jgi:hypothetical protein